MSESTKPAVDPLLSGDSGEAAAVPSYSLDDDSDDDDDEDYNKLEGDYSDDDVSVEDEDGQAGDGHISALASRTNHLINSYRDYIAEMSSDPIVGGDADAAAAVIAVMEGGRTAEDERLEEEAPPPPPGAKGFIAQFQDGRKGATLFRDFSFKDDPPRQNYNVNLHLHRFDDDHSFSTYDGKFENSGRSRRGYFYTMLRSAGFRRCAFGMIALGAIVGISVGITKAQQRKQQESPDWEGMLAEEEQSGTTIYQPVVPIEPNNQSNSKEISQLYQHSSMQYNPVWFSREQGWNGQTYDAAMSFCAAQMGGLIICSYDAICPAGENMMPIGGKKAGAEPNESSWAPFIDEENAWTQVGISESWCEKHDGAPKWGINGEGSEGVTRYVACCRARANDGTATVIANIPSIADAEAEQEFITQESMEKFKGQWFDRTTGWKGATYNQAISFCASKGKMIVCPYEAYCVDGINSVPFGGVKVGFNGEKEQWAPIANKNDEWVQIGPENKCITKSQMQEQSPSWEFTQEGGEVITQHLMCCQIEEVEEASANGGSAPTPVPNDEVQQAQFSWAAEAYEPEWFDRNNGWLGTDYNEAITFCQQKQGKTICPFEAYCPMTKAPGSVPFGGVKSTYSWAPIDDAENWWVQVSDTDTCDLYNEMNGGPPSWGEGGKNEIETGYIMCCKQPDAGMGDADYYHSSMSDGTEANTTTVSINLSECQDHPTAAVTTDGKTCSNFISLVGRVSLHNARCHHESPLKNENGETLLVKDVCRLSCGECGDAWTDEPVATAVEEPVADDIVVGKTPEELGQKYSAVSLKYRPRWYNRENGWNGRTYQESVNFCEAQGPNIMLCPMEALCPNGVGQRPYPGPQILEQESWAAFVDRANGWVHVGGDNAALDCVPYESMHPTSPEWGQSGLNSEEITRHILCCSEIGDEVQVPSQPQPESSTSPTVLAMDASLSVEEYDLLVETGTKFRVNRYDRNSGWSGSSYYEALAFCGKKSATVCPYESYCPQGPSKAVVGGMATSSQWVPFINVANGWIQIGPDDTCMPYSSINPFPPEWGLTGENKAETSHIMCCEPDDNWIPQDQTANGVVSSAQSQIDKIAMDMFKPIWFGRKHGWQGGSHQDALKFCNNIGGMDLCPIMALCPDGKTLFNGMQPFPSEQWSPLSDGEWVLTGTVEADPSATCQMYHVLTNQPLSSTDSLSEEKKQHIMCCAKSDDTVQDDAIKATMQPSWYDSSAGWTGGSHSDAIAFCRNNGGKDLCPYVGYCPHGEGYQPFPGHPVDFNTETLQWSPWDEGTDKGWVLISQKYQNSATTCMKYSDLEGGIPPWDESSNLAERKKYILCCSARDNN
jgi:hypothetical protein